MDPHTFPQWGVGLAYPVVELNLYREQPWICLHLGPTHFTPSLNPAEPGIELERDRTRARLVRAEEAHVRQELRLLDQGGGTALRQGDTLRADSQCECEHPQQ